MSMFVFCVFFAACSNDNDPQNDNPQDDNPQEQPSSELDSESQAIVDKYKDMRIWYGRWEATTYGAWYTDFQFRSDGTCIVITGSEEEYHEAVWNYNPETKLLATTWGSWTWTVNILEPTEWSGTVVGGNSVSYKRRGFVNQGSDSRAIIDPNEELLIGKWIGTDGRDESTELSVTFKANNEYVFTKADTCFYGKYNVELWEHIQTKYEYTYYIYLSGDLSGRMSISMLDGYQLRFYTDNKLGQHLTSYEFPTFINYVFIYSDFVE